MPDLRAYCGSIYKIFRLSSFIPFMIYWYLYRYSVVCRPLSSVITPKVWTYEIIKENDRYCARSTENRKKKSVSNSLTFTHGRVRVWSLQCILRRHALTTYSNIRVTWNRSARSVESQRSIKTQETNGRSRETLLIAYRNEEDPINYCHEPIETKTKKPTINNNFYPLQRTTRSHRQNPQ